MKVSVIMTVYNKALYVKESIESVLNQTMQDFELILINDGSVDNSKEVIDSYKNNPKIKIIHLEENRGIAKATNVGLSQATGEYIAILDGDDIALPNRLEVQTKYLDEHPDIGMIGSYYKVCDCNGEVMYDVKVRTNSEDIKNRIIRSNQFGGSTVMIRKSIVDILGGYSEDEAFGTAADYDLWLRISEVTTVTNLPQYLVLYRVYPDQSTHNNNNSYQARLCVKAAKRRRLQY